MKLEVLFFACREMILVIASFNIFNYFSKIKTLECARKVVHTLNKPGTFFLKICANIYFSSESVSLIFTETGSQKKKYKNEKFDVFVLLHFCLPHLGELGSELWTSGRSGLR
jgi:hypothetical protein